MHGDRCVPSFILLCSFIWSYMRICTITSLCCSIMWHNYVIVWVDYRSPWDNVSRNLNMICFPTGRVTNLHQLSIQCNLTYYKMTLLIILEIKNESNDNSCIKQTISTKVCGTTYIVPSDSLYRTASHL